MAIKQLIPQFYAHGLGELLILHLQQDRVILGNLIFEKGKLTLRDQGLISDMTPSQVQPCWESGLLGMVSASDGQEWESMTFFGLEHCNLPVDLGKTRHGALVAAENRYGESLINFVGSIYRGYQLMMEHHFLPVILLQELHTKAGEAGFAISDLRTVPMSVAMIRNLNEIIWKSVEKRLSMGVDDEQVDPDEFEKLFGDYIAKQ
ncbi:MAG: hypothetical protein WD572_12115 [Gammaproteobacteria bacterium]